MKITKEHKADILRSALAFKYKKLEAEIEAERQLLGDKLYDHLFGAEEELARSMPKGWIHYGRGITIKCDGYRAKGSYCSDDRRREEIEDCLEQSLPLSKDRPFPAARNDEDRAVKPGHPLWKPAWGLVQRHRKLRAEKKETEAQIRRLLASVNTLKQLQAAWPDGERFFPKEVKSYAIVPVGLSDQINKALGLPEKADHATKATRKAAATTK